MVLTSDLALDVSKFDPTSISTAQHSFNDKMIANTKAAGRWYEVGAQAYRELREAGKTPLPGRTVLPQGIDITIPSRDAGREIPARLFLPSGGSAKPVGTYMHIHGGGWVLQKHIDFDQFLQSIADGSGSGVPLATISIGYRLAPENPFPAAANDCADAAEWLARNAASDERLGHAPLAFIGGESAGGHLTMLSAIHLLSLPQPYRDIKGLVLHFGCFSLNPLPTSRNFDQELMLTPDIMDAYRDAFVPQAKNDPAFLLRPDVSPAYVNFDKFRGSLPPALFTCGTSDALLDDTLFMSVKWQAAGVRQTFVKIYPGAPHGYVFFPKDQEPAAAEAAQAMGEFFKLTVG